MSFYIRKIICDMNDKYMIVFYIYRRRGLSHERKNCLRLIQTRGLCKAHQNEIRQRAESPGGQIIHGNTFRKFVTRGRIRTISQGRQSWESEVSVSEKRQKCPVEKNI